MIRGRNWENGANRGSLARGALNFEYSIELLDALAHARNADAQARLRPLRDWPKAASLVLNLDTEFVFPLS